MYEESVYMNFMVFIALNMSHQVTHTHTCEIFMQNKLVEEKNSWMLFLTYRLSDADDSSYRVQAITASRRHEYTKTDATVQRKIVQQRHLVYMT